MKITWPRKKSALMPLKASSRVLASLFFFAFSNAPIFALDGQLGARFLPMGVFSGGENGSYANAVSADGMTVVGQAFIDDHTEAVIWTEATGIKSLGGVDGKFHTKATGVSADGSVIVGAGYSYTGTDVSLFRWTTQEGFTELSGCGCDHIAAGVAISGDGQTVISSKLVSGQNLAFRWRAETGPVDLGDFPGGNTESHAFDSTPDGKTIVGYGFNADDARGFKWTEETGLVELGKLMYSAYAVSSDGAAIAGVGFKQGQGAVRWTGSEGPVWLGHLPGLTGLVASFATDISADGSVIVGGSGEDYRFQAFRWTAPSGMRSVQGLLEELGIDMTGWTLGPASGVSADGSVIVGYGTNPFGETEGWIAAIPPTYVPEPSGFIGMSLASCIVLGSRSIRRRRIYSYRRCPASTSRIPFTSFEMRVAG
jgi:uncharacterized membrane protein